jgi:hypothetical protein
LLRFIPACSVPQPPHPISPARDPPLAAQTPRSLYFKTLAWLRILFLWLALGSVPFLVLVTSSKFTSPALAVRGGAFVQPAAYASAGVPDWGDANAGVRVYGKVGGAWDGF